MTTGLEFLHSPRPALAADPILRTLDDAWNIRGTARDVGGDRDQNAVITTTDGTRYLVKIAQSGEDPGVLGLQIAALNHIAIHDPDLPVPRVIPTREGATTHAVPAGDGGSHVFRVFSFLPGTPILDAGRPPALLRSLGALLARVDRALQGLFHAHAGHVLPWDLRQASALRDCTGAIADGRRRRLVRRVLDHFTANIQPRLGTLPCQIIHGDATAENVLATGASPVPGGLIDFGDVVHAPRAQEVAVAMADATWNLPDPCAAACRIAVGYDEVSPLEDAELSLLHDLACTRVAVSAVVMATRERNRGEGNGSMATLTEPCWRQLEALAGVDRTTAGSRLRHALRAPAAAEDSRPAPPDGERDSLLVRRGRRLMPGLALFYPEDPIHAVCARDMWLRGADGQWYLDCYNNVPQVGHNHRHVVRAVARQTATLNTNVRYLYDSILEYAEALAARLPGELGTIVFVNSGSEANDLAWRMARAFTGHDGALVTANAYHGGTTATAALSPYGAAADAGSPAHVARLPVPEGHHGDGADDAIAGLAARGHGPAAFIVDPALASDGIQEPPDAWMARTARSVRAAGGVCIADEVQSGFGRLGTWWGFEARGFRPDIVTLGKPMANGYPMGAVITTPAIMAAFAGHSDYFSTFGGNPVACMAGLAVLDVIERDDLCHCAAEVGAHLRRRLEALQAHHPAIGDVRGRGLFVGVEMVPGPGALESAPDATTRIALALRRRGVLLGIEGPQASVLKIRPPLTCRHEHADILVDALDGVLSAADA